MFQLLGDSRNVRTPYSTGSRSISQCKTPSQWLLVESKSKMMTPSPMQRVRVRTPSHLAVTPGGHTPSTQKFRVTSAACLTPIQLKIGGKSPCRTPLPVCRKVCSDYFLGLCHSKNCLESHDPSLVSRCVQFATEGKCEQGEKCCLRHDRPNQLDKRPLFDLESYRELHNQKAEELRKKLQNEDQKNREESRLKYTQDVYTHTPLDHTYRPLDYEVAMKQLKEIQEEFFKKGEKPAPVQAGPVIQIVRTDSTGEEDDGIYSDEDSFEVDSEEYFSKLDSWLDKMDITSWTTKQVASLYEEATAKAGGGGHQCAALLDRMFRCYQPCWERWGEVFCLLNMDVSELADTVYEWSRMPGITELHVSGLFAGLLKKNSKTWTMDKISKMLVKVIASSQVSIGILCNSNRIHDGFFFLGFSKYLDIDTAAKFYKFYLKSKEERDDLECTCSSFVCSCPYFVEWDLYGIPLFRPMFDCLDWDLSKKAQLFGKSCEGFWAELEIRGLLESILTSDDEKELVLKHCKPRESTKHILTHLVNTGAFDTIPKLHQELIQSVGLPKDSNLAGKDKSTLVPCVGFEADIAGMSPHRCTGYAQPQCEQQMCSSCCREKLGCLCAAHMQIESESAENMNLFNQLICTEVDEEWDYATFHGITPAMTYDSVREFEESIQTVTPVGEGGERMKRVEFCCGAEVTDNTVMSLTRAFGDNLQVIEFQTTKPDDFCRLKDASVSLIVTSCPNLLKLRLVGCTDVSSDAFIKILRGCPKLMSLEVSGVAKFSGLLKDKCLEPLFEGALPDLHFLNLLDQFFLHTDTVERLRRNRKTLKVLLGQRDSGEMEEDVLEFMAENAAHNPFTNAENFTEAY